MSTTIESGKPPAIRRKPILGPYQRTPEWYALRKEVFGASEAAAICGLSDYRQPLDVYLDKVGGEQREETEAMTIGRFVEPAILGLYCDRTGRDVTAPVPLYRHPGLPYIAASLDGHRADGAPVEAKWSMNPRAAEQLGEEGSDWIPNDWLFQVQQQMDVVDARQADVAVLLFGRLKVYTVEYNGDLIDAIHVAAKEMHERVQRRDPPPVNCEHTSAIKALQRAYPAVVDTSIVLPSSGDVFQAAHDCISMGEAIKAGEKVRDKAKARILAAMGEASSARLPGTDQEFYRLPIGESEVAYTRKAHIQLRRRKAK